MGPAIEYTAMKVNYKLLDALNALPLQAELEETTIHRTK